MSSLKAPRIDRRSLLRLSAGTAALGGLSGFFPGMARAQAGTIDFQAAWINDAEFIGYFIAIDEGYYAEEGIELNYLSGGPDVIPESSLLSERAQIALTTPDTTCRAIAEQGAPFKIIGQQYQKNPIGVVSLAESGINGPHDLVGKTLAVPPANSVTVEAMLKIAGVEEGAVRIVPYQFDPTPLLQGEIDASVDFVTSVPHVIRGAGAEPVSFLLYDHGFKIPNDTVVVSEDFLAENRDLLVKWLRASRKGWEKNAEDLKAYPARYEQTWFAGTGRSSAIDTFQNVEQEPLQQSDGGYFSMSEESIADTIESLQSVGIDATRDMFDTTLLDEV